MRSTRSSRRRGTPGYGKFYTCVDTSNTMPTPDFTPPGTGRTHDEILLEWTAKDPKAAAYDGGAPRELFRVAHPFPNHNGGQIAFNPLARPGTPEFGLLYIGSADGGSGGDPAKHVAEPQVDLRQDPADRSAGQATARTASTAFPPSNPFVKNADALGEIYSYGHRNPQRFSWDPKNGNMFEAEIGQNINEEINQIVAGGNYGWNVWEGSFRFYNREVSIEDQRSDPKMVYPDRRLRPHRPDPAAAGGRHRHLCLSRQDGAAADEHADLRRQPERRDLLRRTPTRCRRADRTSIAFCSSDKGETKTLLQVIKEKNAQQGKMPATRADLRMGMGPNGQLFILNKRDGVIRLLVE